jgi:predicted membrane-bound mannosyltransferase
MSFNAAAALSILATVFAAALARLPALERRPMHADEAILADMTGTLRKSHSWRYDASDFHGVMLPVLGAAVPGPLTETALRLVPAVAGVILAAFATATAGLPAGLMIALSPAMVYWSRFYIPEMLLALLTAVWLYALRGRDQWDWRITGLLAGGMLAAKETAMLAFLAAAAAWFLAKLPRPPARSLALLGAAVLACGALVFTSGLRDWSQVGRMPSALLSRASGAGHAHPFWFYFSVLRWELLAIPLAALAWRRDRFLAAYALVLGALYCVIPYKTPWCSVQFWWPVLILAGGTPKFACPLAAAFAAVSFFTSFLHPASPVNPYVYAQTLPEALEIPRRLASLAGRGETIQFFTRQNLWPLPWYLRAHPQQEWRRDIDFAARPAPVIVVTPELEPKLAEWLYERRPPGQRDLYMRAFEEPVFLRPGVEVRVYRLAGAMR